MALSNPPLHGRGETPPWARLLWRGATKRCPNCGGGHIYAGWFRMRERCPSCGMKFEREEGFFVGAYVINLTITIVLLFAVSIAFIAVKARNVEAEVTIPIIAGLVLAVVAPPFFYPYSRTIWSAIDLAMTPLHPVELAEAYTAVAAADPTLNPADRRRGPDEPDRPSAR